jgi:hypothetical protein
MDASPPRAPGAPHHARAIDGGAQLDGVPWLLVFVASAIVPLLWTARGHAPGPGSTLEASLTLITADKQDLHCALDARVHALHCGFRAPGLPFALEPASRDGVLQPFVTLEGVMFLVSDLFAQRALAQRYAREVPDGRPRARYRRFVAHCRVRLLQRVDGASVQFGPGAAWGPAPPSWVVEPVSCRVSG